MYALYKKVNQGTNQRLKFQKEISLFGCNVGYFAKLLRQIITKEQGEPFKWHVSVIESLSAGGEDQATIVIDIKPQKSEQANATLLELLDIWGYSNNGWTPVLMRMRGLLVDEDPNLFDKLDIPLLSHPEHETIYSLTYLWGTVLGGQLKGTWTGPPPSSTNSVLLWPEALRYFVEVMEKVTPELFL